MFTFSVLVDLTFDPKITSPFSCNYYPVKYRDFHFQRRSGFLQMKGTWSTDRQTEKYLNNLCEQIVNRLCVCSTFRCQKVERSI